MQIYIYTYLHVCSYGFEGASNIFRGYFRRDGVAKIFGESMENLVNLTRPTMDALYSAIFNTKQQLFGIQVNDSDADTLPREYQFFSIKKMVIESQKYDFLGDNLQNLVSLTHSTMKTLFSINSNMKQQLASKKLNT